MSSYHTPRYIWDYAQYPATTAVIALISLTLKKAK